MSVSSSAKIHNVVALYSRAFLYPCAQSSMLSFFNFQTIEALSCVPCPELSLRLYLQCAEVLLEQIIDSCLHWFLLCDCILYAGCQWLWFGTSCLWILHTSIHLIWRGNCGMTHPPLSYSMPALDHIIDVICYACLGTFECFNISFSCNCSLPRAGF